MRVILLLLMGCADASSAGHDRDHGFAELHDLGPSQQLAGGDLAGGTADLAVAGSDLAMTGTDLAAAGTDLAMVNDLAPARDLLPAPPDLLPPPVIVQHVHILIDNFCNTATDPAEITSPLHQPLELEFHNHSVDYAADVWLSYIGGFQDLETGATWHDKFQHCMNPVPYDGYADVSINGGGTSACPKFRMMIHCR